MIQVAIAFDQLVNTLCGGWADETISARLYRNQFRSWWWCAWFHFVNGLFFNRNHCFDAYISEMDRKQLPESYRC